jgi:putative oxidoreductase
VTITRRIARPMLAAMFVSGGIEALRHPDTKVAKAEAVTQPVSDTLGLAQEAVDLVRINGAVMVAGGLLLASGRVPRLSATALAATLVPTTLAGHRFWECTDPKERTQQRVHFLKNVSMLGGLILAATDTEGAPSLTWRAKRTARKALDLFPH